MQSNSRFPFFLSFICETRSFIASYAILSICCPIVVTGMIASEAIGESSNPTMRYSSERQPYSRMRRLRKMLAWVSFAIKFKTSVRCDDSIKDNRVGFPFLRRCDIL